MAKTPEEIKANRQAGMARAREARKLKSLNEESSGTTKKEVASVKTLYFENEYHDYANYVKGLEIGIKQLDLRSVAELKRAVPLAEEFVKLCKEKYPQ